MNLMRGLLLALSFGVTSIAAAADFQTGLEAYRKGDYATAFQEFEPLAEKGDASAQFNLGFLYDNGQGVPQDYAMAVTWYRKAAEQGNANAQINLAILHRVGRGVTQDDTKATWYRKAAEQGEARAQQNLGTMYGYGQGVPQDYVQAHMWLNLAASQGVPNAAENRGVVADRMTSDQIAEAQKLAREWAAEHR